MLTLQDMRIVIPTLGRVDHQPTWDNTQHVPIGQITLLAPYEEFAQHSFHGRTVEPTAKRGIANVRQYIIDSSYHPLVCMIDDDMIWLQRIVANDWHLRRAHGADVVAMFQAIVDQFNANPRLAHVGVSPRAGNNRSDGWPSYNGRLNNIHVFRREALLRHGIQFNNLPGLILMEDFHVTLALLLHGYQNMMLNHWAWDQGSSNAPGGCSTYRSAATQEASARVLAATYPDFVRLRQKATKTAWKGVQDSDTGKRWDVTIQWKKAYEQGQRSKA